MFNRRYILEKRIKILSLIFICFLLFLIIRISYLQNKFNPIVTGTELNNSINKEKISNYNYLLLDRNGKDLNNYNRKYKVFINGKTFAMNARNQNLDELMTFNYILLEEIKDFSINDIVQKKYNVTYEISEYAFNQINDMSGLKGIYVYKYDEIEEKNNRSIEKVIMETKGFNIKNKVDDYKKDENSLEMKINNYVKNNLNHKEVFEKDLTGIYENNNYELNKDNNNIRLTLDKDYQSIIREVLSREKYKEFSNIGVAITDGQTGEVLAMAQKNENEPNLISGAGGILGYEPGSTFKILTLEAARKYLNTSLSDEYLCQGNICKKDKIHGKISVEKAMEVSCNDIFAILGNKIGKEKLIEFAKEQGYFEKVLELDSDTGMEAKGALPGEGSTAGITAIGQTILATPIQVLGTMSTIVNNGVYQKPYIFSSVENQNGEVIETFKAEEKRVMSEEDALVMKNLLIKATNDGSGINAKIDGIEIGGKTGTAEANGKSHGWFLGFFKQNNKYYNMVVFLPYMPDEDSNGFSTGGGNSAAPIFKEIVLELIKNK